VNIDAEKIKDRGILRDHTDMVTSLVLIPNTPMLISGSLDASLTTWDIYTGTKQRDLRGHTKGVLAMAYSHEHRFLITAGSDRDVLVWNPMVKTRPVSIVTIVEAYCSRYLD
jgi:WD40 repeat protein